MIHVCQGKSDKRFFMNVKTFVNGMKGNDKMYSENSKMSFLQRLLTVALGNLLYAFIVQLFIIPSGLVTGGTTGMALAANHLWGVSVSGFVFIFNVLMLIIGWLALGKHFALTTLASTFLYPAFLKICERLIGSVKLTEDLMLCAIFSGLGVGIALGIVLRAGASTGGMDIPPLLLKKLFGIPVSVSMYGFDFCILLAQATFRPTENILYGVLLVLIYTITLDKMLMLGASRTEVKIVSRKSQEISNAILEKIDRGVTLLHGEGGYLHEKTQLVFSVISNRELLRVEKLVHEIDPECFIVVSRVSEVGGRGFSMKKNYR